MLARREGGGIHLQNYCPEGSLIARLTWTTRRYSCKISSLQMCQSPKGANGDSGMRSHDVLVSQTRSFPVWPCLCFTARYLLMLMMWPSSTFRSFIDLYASRVQMDRAKTFTWGGETRYVCIHPDMITS